MDKLFLPIPSFSMVHIEDSEADRYILRRILQSERPDLVADLREAGTGQLGLALCRERRPDCILLDCALGDMDAVRFLSELNAGRDAEEDPYCPVVIVSGIGTLAQVAVRAMKGGAQDYLLKENLTAASVLLAIEKAVEKVRLRRELRDAEARFRSSLDNMLDCFGIYTSVRNSADRAIMDFRCEYVNDAACHSNQMLREEQVGRLLVAEILPAHGPSGLFDEYVRVVESGIPINKTDFVYSDTEFGGKGFNIERAFDVRVWKMGDGIAAAWRNVTSEKRAESALREAEDRLAFAVDASELGVFEVDCITGAKQYSPRAFDLIGIRYPHQFSPSSHGGDAFGAVAAEEFWERCHPSDRERVSAALQRAYDPDSGAKGVYEAEYRVQLISGAERWIGAKGRVTFDEDTRSPLRLTGLLQDITERKLEQQQVKLLAAVVEHSEDFIGVADPDGRAMFVNGAGQRLVGLSDGQAVKRTMVTDYFFPDDANKARETAIQAMTVGRASVETQFRHFVTGEAIDVTWNVMAIRDELTNEPYALATLTRDIREQKRIEAERAAIALRREHIAESVQRSLLLIPAPDAYPGITVEPYYKSALDEALVGGDFFDIFAVSEELVALVVGDATGKGVEAAIYTAEVKFALRAFLREHRGDMNTSMRLLNEFVCENERFDAAHTSGSYIALVAVLVNTFTGEVACCCAGAEPPVIVRAETGDVVEAVSSFGSLLGAFETAKYPVSRHVLGIGDIIALTTDGITEARKPVTIGIDGTRRTGEFFGTEGFAVALSEEAAKLTYSLGDVERAVVERALDWAGGRQHDDICVLLAKRN